MNIHVTACVRSVHHQHAHMISDGHASIDNVLVKVKTSLHQAFSQVVDVVNLCFIHTTHCCITPHVSKFKAHDDPGPLWWNLMQLSLVISNCNITFLVFWLSQGTVATLITWGGWSSYCHMCHSFLNLTVKIEKLIKIHWFLTKLQIKISWLLFMAHCVYAHFLGLLPLNGILPGAKFTMRPSLAFSYISSVTARHGSFFQLQLLLFQTPILRRAAITWYFRALFTAAQ